MFIVSAQHKFICIFLETFTLILNFSYSFAFFLALMLYMNCPALASTKRVILRQLDYHVVVFYRVFLLKLSKFRLFFVL